LANSQVEIGATTNYGSTTTLDPILALSHLMEVTGLLASTTYHYRVKSIDDAGISLWGLIKHLLRRPHQVILMAQPK